MWASPTLVTGFLGFGCLDTPITQSSTKSMSLSVTQWIKKKGLSNVVPVPRVPELRALEGKTILRVHYFKEKDPNTQEILDRINARLDHNTLLITLADGSKISLGKFLFSRLRFSSVEVDRIVKSYKSEEVEMKLTCAYKSLLRASDTRHFTSCNRSVNKYLLKCPYVAIIGKKDRSGDWAHRMLVYWISEGPHTGLLLTPHPYPKTQDFQLEAVEKSVPIWRTDILGKWIINWDSFDKYFPDKSVYNDIKNKGKGLTGL